MAERPMRTEQQSLDGRLTAALEQRPEVNIPADFAAKIAARFPAGGAVDFAPNRYGRSAAVLCMVVLLAIILTLAFRNLHPSLVWTAAEWIFCTQLALVAVWLRFRLYS